MPGRNRDALFRESLNPSSPRRLGRGVAISLVVHLLVLWGFQRFTAYAPSGNAPEVRAGEIRGSESSVRPGSPAPGGLKEKPKSKRRQQKPLTGRIGGRLAVGGAAAAGFRVEARRAGKEKIMDSAILDPAGNFMLGLLPAGPYEFSLWHEDRLVSRVQVRIRSGTFLDLEWTPELNARLRPAGEMKTLPPDPREFWRLFREPTGRRWRDNLESMLSRAGVSREARFARRRAEDLWEQCRRAGDFLASRLKATLKRVSSLIGKLVSMDVLPHLRPGMGGCGGM